MNLPARTIRMRFYAGHSRRSIINSGFDARLVHQVWRRLQRSRVTPSGETAARHSLTSRDVQLARAANPARASFSRGAE